MIISGSSGSISCVGARSGSSSSSTCHRSVGAHRRKDPAAHAGLDPKQPKAAREPQTLGFQLAVGHLPNLARLAFPHEGRLVVKLLVAMPVEAAVHDVHARPAP